MIKGIFHQGSGLGNQLHRYVATRVKALDLGVDWGMVYREDSSGKQAGFKGASFFEGDFFGKTQPDDSFMTTWSEHKITDQDGVDIRSYDPEFNFIEDNTIIDGEFQAEQYWEHHEKEVDEWLKVKPLGISDDLCVIGFRGGEFALYPDLFLTKEYYLEAINKMKDINPNMKFQVHTDDLILARERFPDYEVVQNMELNWRTARYAKYAIIPNSSFFIFPRWLRNGVTIAPRYWARHNTKTWSMPQNYYKNLTYI